MAATTEKTSTFRLCIMTKSAKRSTNFVRSFSSFLILTLTGRIAMRAGRNDTDRMNAAATPTAVILPRSWKGAPSVKFNVKKPTIVVTLVVNTGMKLMRRLSTIASLFCMPERINCSIVSNR